MAETGTAGPATTTHPLVKKVHASKPPIAQLIGFDVEGTKAIGPWLY